MTESAIPYIPVSWGELLDKIAILEIKRARIADSGARANVAHELDLLAGIAAPVIEREEIAALIEQLRAVNEALWEVEDAIREEERASRFGAAFVALARTVYARNDERAAVKRAINLVLGSALVEEKSYKASSSQCVAAE